MCFYVETSKKSPWHLNRNRRITACVMKKIFFLKQSTIVLGQAHVEDYIEEALVGNRDVDLIAFDIAREIKNIQRRVSDDREVIRECLFNLIQKIKTEAPDAILFLNGYAIDQLFPSVFKLIKKLGTNLIAWHADDPYYIDIQKELTESFDYIFTVDKSTVTFWKQFTKNSYYLPFACSKGVVDTLATGFEMERYKCDICFVGAPFKGSERVGVIDRNAEFLNQYDTRIFGATKIDTWRNTLKNYDVLKDKIYDFFLDPSEANKYYYSTKINLNIHKQHFGHIWDRNSRQIRAISPNEKFFFIGGLGGFQVVDNSRDDLPNMFPEELVVSYDSDESFRNIIRDYLKNEEERTYKASKLQKIILAEHTYDKRIEFILDKLRD